MRRRVLSYVAGQVRRFAAVPVGGVRQVVEDNLEVDGGRRRPRPKAYRKKAPKEHVTPFKETVDASGDIERRCIRTRPRRRDDTKLKRELQKCVSFREEMVTLGKYVEPPKFNPERPDLEDGDIDLECLPDEFEFLNPFTKKVEKIDFSVLRLGKDDSSKVPPSLFCLIERVYQKSDVGGEGAEVDRRERSVER